MTYQVADSNNLVAIGALALLGFSVGFSVILTVVRMIKRRREFKRRDVLIDDQQWLSEAGKSRLLSNDPLSLVRLISRIQAPEVYEDDLRPDHRYSGEEGHSHC